MPECKKCPYFVKETKNQLKQGRVIMGFCRLRQKDISDVTISNRACKDRAIFAA